MSGSNPSISPRFLCSPPPPVATLYPCATCTRAFLSFDDCDEHMNNEHHWATCETCNRVFRTRQGAKQHMQDKNHYRNYCTYCHRGFINDHERRAHIASCIQSSPGVKCPLCRLEFTTAREAARHLENGSCLVMPQMDPCYLHGFMREKDPGGVVTNEPKTDQWNLLHHEFNGHQWECCLCHKGFATVDSLDQHVQSAAHKLRRYRCPCESRCRREFTSLSGLFGHLESGSCGYVPAERVQWAQDLFMNLLTGAEKLTGA